MRKLKVCMLVDVWTPVYGGGKAHVWEVSKRLVDDYNCKVDIITRALEDDYGNAFSDNESYFDGRLNVFRLKPCNRFENKFGRFLFLFTPISRLVRGHYDIVNAQSLLPAIPAKLGRILGRYRLVYTVHGTLLFMKGRRFRRLLHEMLICKTRYDRLVSVSENILSRPNVNENIAVVPNGVDIEKFDKIAVKKSSRFRILYVGRFDRIKGLDYLIKAIDLIPEDKRNFELHMIGYGYDKENLTRLIKELGLENTIRFRGRITDEELIKEYKSSHLFVLPSLSEGQPLTLLEAFAAKLPVIATDVGDNRKFIEEGVNGYLVNPEDPDKLAETMIEAMENKNLGRMGVNGYKTVQGYTWDKTAERIFKIYEKVIKNARD